MMTTRDTLTALTGALIIILVGALTHTAPADGATLTQRDCREYARIARIVDQRPARVALLDCQHKRCQLTPGTYRTRNACTIRLVFGRFGTAAVTVATCESGLSTRAHNGHHHGMFQLGSHERARYGNATTPRGQAEAAHHYFTAVGHRWTPWTCQP